NEGSFRPVHITAPEGCIFNPRRPAAVAGRHLVGHLLPSAVFGALARAVPENIVAEGASAVWITQTHGVDLDDHHFTFVFFSMGGMGARPNKDGISNVGFPSGVAGVPVEAIESVSPLVLRKREMRPDSGGPGKYRGGLGQDMRMAVRTRQPYIVASMFEKMKFEPQGLLGGGPGARGDFQLSTGERPNAKQQNTLPADVEVDLRLPGGGGYGNPFEREPLAVLEDVVMGYVSLESAARDYGVAIECTKAPDDLIALPEDYRIDWERTAASGSRSPRSDV
ncbi:MAG: hydantoinase B/oxoprolinase family protein, partial [Chloroflexi bacterium]|nr:hydantoinase B/oxoprolinase family protein [Chloroflexota bacterium]